MQRKIKKTFIVVMSVICVLLLVSPMVFAKPFVKINDQGLKSLHMRAFIIEEGSPSGHGPKHGRVQAMITEIEKILPEDPVRYSYNIVLDMKKAVAGATYEMKVKFTLPNIVFTIYGDESGLWNIIEDKAGELGLDSNPLPGEITVSLADLNIADNEFEMNTGKQFTCDNRGNYKETKTGVIEEMVAIDYALDLAWPFLWQYLLEEYPVYTAVINYIFGVDRDFLDFGIIGVSIPPGNYEISGGVRFINTEDAGNIYCTETISFTYSTIGFQWWAPGWP